MMGISRANVSSWPRFFVVVVGVVGGRGEERSLQCLINEESPRFET